MSTLRLRDSDDEVDDEDSLLPRALEVPSGSEPEDDGFLPSSALQYLRYVRKEQARQDEIVTADLAKLRIKTAEPKKPSRLPATDVAAAGFRLSRHWQQAVESEFSELRCRLGRWKARHSALLRRQAATLPAPDDGEAWLAVCSRGSDGPAGDLGPPSLHTVSACSQRQVQAVLGHVLRWTDRHGLNSSRAAWLFSLMAVLEKPVTADTCSCLRQMARLCRTQRDRLARDDPRLAAGCLLVCLVGRYFGQADLADPW